jgi:FkbM family methyltransferase
MSIWAGQNGIDWLFGTLLRDSAHTIVLSSPHRDLLSLHQADIHEKVIILPPPPLIRMTKETPEVVRRRIRNLIGAAERDFVLVYWGYIYPGKGVETLLRAFRLASKTHGDMRLLLVGGKLEITGRREDCVNYFNMVRRLPDELGVADRVTWTGEFTWNEDIGSQYLHGADVCVLPLDYGITLNNSSLAAACTHGLPVISTELPKGCDEALDHGQNIYLCRAQDPALLAEVIEQVREDADFRDRLKIGGLRLARDWYTWEASAKRLETVLESAISRIRSAQAGKDCPSDTMPSVRGTVTSLNKDSLPSGSPAPSKQLHEKAPTPFVSVVVAVHNVDRYLRQCLDALINQTLKNIEIIVVNDASSDHCADIIHEYKSLSPNVKVITCTSNKGLASVRNIGLRAATGQYIAFADGDDWVDVRMCERLYSQARDNRAEVVIADATVFYEDTKRFGPFFDQHIRQTLPAQLRKITFGLSSEPRVILLEPVAWTKLYKTDFLREHSIQFEEGMNSYEDICFHFTVLLKAKRISLLDEKLFFYRQNRPGQISGRTNRKIFEVFEVFKRIHHNLGAWNAHMLIWSQLAKIEVRQFNWLMKDRVRSEHKREFLTLASDQLRSIPSTGFNIFVQQASPYELATALCLRRSWLLAYERVARDRWQWLFTLSLLQRDTVTTVLKRLLQQSWAKLRTRLATAVRRPIHRLLDLEQLRSAATATAIHDRVATNPDSPRHLLIEVCHLEEHKLFFSRPTRSGLQEALRRVEHDYYLLQTAIFREGDTIIDVGAHVGVVSIVLAKKFPFVKVYAVEPNPVNYLCLQRNIELNGVTNIIALNKAMDKAPGRRILYTSAMDDGWATIDAKLASSRHLLSSVEVDTLTLDQLFEDYGISHCRLLKITAPGAVKGSLRGFTKSRSVDLLCGEVDLRDCSQIQLELASWRIARQHFWRMVAGNGSNMHRWIHHTARIDAIGNHPKPRFTPDPYDDVEAIPKIVRM